MKRPDKILDGRPWRYYDDRGWLPLIRHHPSLRGLRRPTKRRILWQATEGLCALCGIPIETLEEVTFDHTVPKSRGGVNERNETPAHRLCNERKGSRKPTGCEIIFLAVVNAKIGAVP